MFWEADGGDGIDWLRGAGGRGYSRRLWRFAPERVRFGKVDCIGVDGRETEWETGFPADLGGSSVGSGIGEMGEVSRAVLGRWEEFLYLPTKAENGLRVVLPDDPRLTGLAN